MSSGSNSVYGHNWSLSTTASEIARDIAAKAAKAAEDAKAAKAAAAAAEAAPARAAHVPLTQEEFDAKYAHIECPLCRQTAKNFGEPNYKKECIHKKGEKGGAKKRSRRLRRGKSKSKFQRRGKSVKRRRRY